MVPAEDASLLVPDDDRASGRVARLHGRAVVALRYPIVLAWIAAAVAATLLLPSLDASTSTSPDDLVPSSAPALSAARASVDHFGAPLGSDVAIVQHAPGGLAPGVVDRAVAAAATVPLPSDLHLALPIANVAQLPFAREHDTAILTFLYFDERPSFEQRVAEADAYARTALGHPDDAVVGLTGAIPARVHEEQVIGDRLPLVTAATVLATVLVLALLLRTALAPLIALATSGIAYLVAVRVVGEAGRLLGFTVPRELEPFVVVLLLAICTDYAIFHLDETRRLVRRGYHRRLAVRLAATHVAPIVLTAGLIVSGGAAALVVGDLGFLRALGPGLGLAAAVGTLASLTLAPALMAIGSPVLFRRIAPEREVAPPAILRRPRLRRVATSRLAALVVVLVAGGALAACAWQARHARIGVTLTRGADDQAPTTRATHAAQTAFAAGAVSPTEVVLVGDGVGGRADGIAALEDAIARVRGVAGVVGPREEALVGRQGVFAAADGRAARLLVVLDDDPFSHRAIATLGRVQDVVDRAAPALGARAGLAGGTALARDTVDASTSELARLAAAVLLVNLVFLVAFLRAVVAPLYLLAASALALLAALGIAVRIAQDQLGYDELPYYVPIAAAVLLLSLGSDYTIMVVGRIWAEARRRPVEVAVLTATPKASRAVGAAGLVMALSFALLGLIPLVPFRELALIMAVGVLLDALVVRSVLAPALVTLFGALGGWPGRTLAAPAEAPPETSRAPGGESARRPAGR